MTIFPSEHFFSIPQFEPLFPQRCSARSAAKRYALVRGSSSTLPFKTVLKNFPVGESVGSAVKKNLSASFFSFKILICVEVPAPSIPSNTTKFFKIIIPEKLQFFYSSCFNSLCCNKLKLRDISRKISLNEFLDLSHY